jgi:hypothetical protein
LLTKPARVTNVFFQKKQQIALVVCHSVLSNNVKILDTKPLVTFGIFLLLGLPFPAGNNEEILVAVYRSL